MFFTHAGVEQTAEKLEGVITSYFPESLDYFNQTLITSADSEEPERFLLPSGEMQTPANYIALDAPAVHTHIGLLQIRNDYFRIADYDGGFRGLDTITLPITPYTRMAYQNDLLYLTDDNTTDTSFGLVEIISDTEINFIKELNIARDTTLRDIAIYQDTLYIHSVTNRDIATIDIRKYRPIAKNTKTTIYPVFANEGDTIDLTQFSPDAERIVADVGFDKPDYLTFNTSNELVIDADAVTETHPVYIPLKAINRIDATETGTFGFYLIIQQANAPIWREFADLSMPADSAFNLFDVVEGADSITGTTLPTGASVSNGRLTIGTQGGTVVVRATNATGNADHTFIANVVQAGDPANYSNEFRYRVQIANIDVTSDLKVSPSVSESLDAVILNETVLDEVSFTLRNDVQNGFRFSDTTPNNFWIENSLTEGGFRVGVKIFVESLVSGSIVQSLLFVGVIFDSVVSTVNADIAFTIVDLSFTFDRRSVEGLGQLTKWDALRQETDEASFEGVYIPEGAVTPMQIRTGKAWSDRSPITISDLGLPREGPTLANTGYLTPTNFNVSGGFFATPPLLEFKPERRSEDVPYLFQQLAINGAVFNSHVMLSDREADSPFVLNRGSVSFSVENTRNTRLLTDWVQNSTNETILMLLSNPEGHVSDLLVEYDVADDFHRITYTFDKAIKTHRITRRNANNYYILTSAPITQNRSSPALPRTGDKTAYAFDSRSVGSDVRIYAYNTNTGVLTAHVQNTNTYPPQLGIHYHVGFENAIYIDEFEGISSDYRGAFKRVGSYLYYRYAKDGEFGVARVNASGTTEKVIDNSADIEMDAFFASRGGPPSIPVVIVPEVSGHLQTPAADFLEGFSLPISSLPNIGGMTIDTQGDMYVLAGGDVSVFPANTTDGDDAVASRQFGLPTGVSSEAGIAIQGNDLYILNRSDMTVTVVPAHTADGQTATATRQFTINIGLATNLNGLAIEGNNLFISSRSNNVIYIVAADTPNGGLAGSQRFFNLPHELSTPSNVEALALYGNTLAVTNPQRVVLVAANTPNGGTASILRQINIPSLPNNNISALGFGRRTFNLEDASNFKQSLNFAFDVTSAGTVYLAECIEGFGFSILIIKRRVSGGTETLVFSDVKSITGLTDLDDNGGTYEGVHECLFHNNFLYMLVEVGRADIDDSTDPSTYTRSRTNAAGMVLFSCDVTASTPSLTVIETWDFATHGGCNLTVHDGDIHFVEQPIAAEQFLPINSDL